ncbi:MAG: transporter substrate-binding domain-containing protein [Paracoccaceae bacterium]
MVRGWIAALALAVLWLGAAAGHAQDNGAGAGRGSDQGPVQVVTVTRPPFSLVEDGAETGFSLDLWRALSEDIGVDTEILRVESFRDMLDMVRKGGPMPRSPISRSPQSVKRSWISPSRSSKPGSASWCRRAKRCQRASSGR